MCCINQKHVFIIDNFVFRLEGPPMIALNGILRGTSTIALPITHYSSTSKLRLATIFYNLAFLFTMTFKGHISMTNILLFRGQSYNV
jgi:hypothetical protein